MTHASQKTGRQHPHQGIALPTVMVMLLLSSWWAVTAWRSVWLHELLLQARSDALQTQWVADATLLIALDDLLQNNAAASVDQRHHMGSSEQQHVFFPKTIDELAVLRQRLGSDVCRQGICAPLQLLPSTATHWQSILASGMPVGIDNNLLQDKNPRYWVEIFLTTEANDANPFVFRITAMATGWKSAYPTVIQAVWQPDGKAANASNNASQGRWTSWAVLHAP